MIDGNCETQKVSMDNEKTEIIIFYWQGMANALSVLGTGGASYITFVLVHVYCLLEIFIYFFFQTIASTHILY